MLFDRMHIPVWVFGAQYKIFPFVQKEIQIILKLNYKQLWEEVQDDVWKKEKEELKDKENQNKWTI